VKILLSGHAHFDHVGGHAALQQATGAKVMALTADVPALTSGKDLSPLGAEGWQPVHVDRVLQDGAVVRLGTTQLRAVLAPGHTPGCTVWTTQTKDDQPGPTRSYAVAFYACAGPNQSVELLDNPKFPSLVADTRRAFARLKKLHPDIYLLMHPKSQFAETAESIKAGVRPHPLHDPAAWHKVLDEGATAFEARVVEARSRAREKKKAERAAQLAAPEASPTAPAQPRR
jgi:metallo-beta-lactamase class B